MDSPDINSDLLSNDTFSPDAIAWRPIKASLASMRTSNPIRDIVDGLKIPPNPIKPLISLSIGDPTVFGNLNNPININEALIKSVKSGKANGYAHSAGYLDSRKALAKKYSLPDFELSPDDVVISNGCSGAIEMAIGVLANPGQNILIPAPGFSIYQTICDHKGIRYMHYNLLPDKDWEIDLNHLESLIDHDTAAILINNPSNPCGSVFSKEHIQHIIRLADRKRVPILADEIYEGIIFEGTKFYSMASQTKNVPILTVGGLSKLYLLPGWRVGWIIIYDRLKVFQEIRTGLVKSSQLILGANTLAQSVIEDALFNTPQSYYDDLCKTLHANAMCLVNNLSKVPGLKIISPHGAMYMMVGIEIDKFEGIADDVDFSKKLLEEEVVLILPGRIFKCANYFRLVICPPVDKLEEASQRISAFCKRHLKASS